MLRQNKKNTPPWRWPKGYALLVLLLFLGCQQQAPPRTAAVAFYHWQQKLQPDSLPQCLLQSFPPDALATKIMDIGWEAGQPKLLAKLEIATDSLPFRLLPVVFITNEVMLQANEATLEQLADDLLQTAAQRIIPQRQMWEAITAWQFDCDWTSNSQARYFYFLQQIRKRLPKGVQLSATIRLHQYAHARQQGVPPVDRGLLMAYNMGELDDINSPNSILDTNISRQYLRPDIRYPLALDVALPYYQWGAIYRNGELAYLYNELDANKLADSQRFMPQGAQLYRVLQPTYLGIYYLYPGDIIRLEGVDQASLLALAKQLQHIPPCKEQRLYFYHLGSQRAKQCRLEELPKVLAAFNGSDQ